MQIILGLLVIGVLGAVFNLIKGVVDLVTPYSMQLIVIASVIAIAAFFVKLARDEWERRERAEERRRQEEARYQANQRSIQASLVNIVSESSKAARELPDLLRGTEHWLNHAEREFSEGVFAPFWEAVEKAALTLATFNNHIKLLDRKAIAYKDQASRLDVLPPPPYNLGIRTIPYATRTVERMRAIVRRAQKDPDFSKIYEQRRTNQLLVEGFSTLGQALSELRGCLESSFDSLTSSVSSIASSQNQAATALVAELKETRNQMERESEARRKHEREETRMLQEIQR